MFYNSIFHVGDNALKKSCEMPTARNNLRLFVRMRPNGLHNHPVESLALGGRESQASGRKVHGLPSLYHPRDEASVRSDRRNHRSFAR